MAVEATRDERTLRDASRNEAGEPMSWLVRAFRTRERRHATVPLTLAIVVVALGVLLYLELVTVLVVLVAYAG